MQTVRDNVAIEPLIYRAALTFSLEELRPRGQVSLLSPTNDLAGEVGRVGGHLDVANRVPPTVKLAAQDEAEEKLLLEKVARGA